MNPVENPICVIEDNTPIRKLFCTLLKKAGFNTVDFADGTNAVNWLRSRNNPHAVIVDILLPDINGTEILKIIRELQDGNAITVIAATGFAHAQDREKFLEMGFDGYIPKPVNISSFVDDIKAIIELKNN